MGAWDLVFLYNYCHGGRCENSLISVDFIVMIHMKCIICTVTDGYNVWVLVGLSRCVCGSVCPCVCVRCVCGVCVRACARACGVCVYI